MDRAPSVVYPVGRTRALAWVLAVLAGSGAALLFSVLFRPLAHVQRAPAAIVLIVSWLGAVAAMWHFWRRQRPRQLRWDGECWFVGAPTDAEEQGGGGARVEVRWDAQRWMLLWFHPGAAGERGRWLWAEAASEPARWHLLRCALYLPLTSASVGAPPSSEAGRA